MRQAAALRKLAVKRRPLLTTAASDGTQVRAYDEGQGPPILLLGAGIDDGSRTEAIARLLAPRFRVLRLERRQYRLDLPGRGSWPIAYEVDDAVVLARKLSGPAVLYGHSDGGVVALEALVAAPSLFAGAVIVEPTRRSRTPAERN